MCELGLILLLRKDAILRNAEASGFIIIVTTNKFLTKISLLLQKLKMSKSNVIIFSSSDCSIINTKLAIQALADWLASCIII